MPVLLSDHLVISLDLQDFDFNSFIFLLASLRLTLFDHYTQSPNLVMLGDLLSINHVQPELTQLRHYLQLIITFNQVIKLDQLILHYYYQHRDIGIYILGL